MKFATAVTDRHITLDSEPGIVTVSAVLWLTSCVWHTMGIFPERYMFKAPCCKGDPVWGENVFCPPFSAFVGSSLDQARPSKPQDP